MLFRVLRGLHSQGSKLYGPGMPDGDLVETETDLVKKFNAPGSVKFERIWDQSQTATSLTKQSAAEARQAEPTNSPPAEDLESLSMVELLRIAEDLELDFPQGKTPSKAQLIKTIRAARASTLV